MNLSLISNVVSYYNVFMSNYFNEALHNFTSDYAYGSQVRSLYNKGLSASQIKEKLDYPVSIEKVSSYLWDYLITSNQVVFNESDILSNPSAPKYSMETDSYGRRSFRLLSETSSRKGAYTDVLFHGQVNDIPNLYDCFAKFEGKSISSYNEYLNSKQIDYLSGFPWPKREVYVHLNERLSEILSVLHSQKAYNGVIFAPTDGIKYILC